VITTRTLDVVALFKRVASELIHAAHPQLYVFNWNNARFTDHGVVLSRQTSGDQPITESDSDQQANTDEYLIDYSYFKTLTASDEILKEFIRDEVADALDAVAKPASAVKVLEDASVIRLYEVLKTTEKACVDHTKRALKNGDMLQQHETVRDAVIKAYRTYTER